MRSHVDVTADPVATLEQAIDLGLRRVLSSGGASTAQGGIDTLRAMVDAASGRIEVMAGSGVNAASAPALAAVGVDALHFSAKRTIAAPSDGSVAASMGGHDVTDRDAAFAVRKALGL